MASPPANGGSQWAASEWFPLVPAEVARSPDAYGVVILGDAHREPLLVSHGPIQEVLRRFHRSPRAAAHGAAYFKFIETLLEREAELLAVIVRQELAQTAHAAVAWMDFPAPLSLLGHAGIDEGPRPV